MVRRQRPAAVCFDMDGLMVDTESLYFAAEGELLARRGLTFSPDLGKRMMGLPGLVAMELLRDEHGLSEPTADLFDECQTLFVALVETKLSTMPGLEQLLTMLETHDVPKAVVTSTHRELAHDILGKTQLLERFSFVVTSDDIVRGKPDPEIYELACRKLRANPIDVVVLEDSYNGTLSAKSAGCRTVAVPHQYTADCDFSHVDLVAGHLVDPALLEFLDMTA